MYVVMDKIVLFNCSISIDVNMRASPKSAIHKKGFCTNRTGSGAACICTLGSIARLHESCPILLAQSLDETIKCYAYCGSY